MHRLIDTSITHMIRELGGRTLAPVWRILFQYAATHQSMIESQLDSVLESGALYRRFPAIQIRSEILPLLKLLMKQPPTTVVEIGTANGGTLWLLTRVAASNALILSIDLPYAPEGSGYSKWREKVYTSFGKKHQNIELIRANSHCENTICNVQKVLHFRQIDFLLIDGDHSYEGVKADWNMYRPLLAPHGIIAFHDIVPGANSRVGGVPKLWSEIRSEVAYCEFVEDWEQGGFGIGVVLPCDHDCLHQIGKTTNQI